MPVKIYVGNLPYTYAEEDLKKLFESYGEVTSAKVITDRDTGRSRGFGFVEMANKEEAAKAMDELGRKKVGERTLVVNEARPQEKREGGGGGERRERSFNGPRGPRY